MTSVYKFVSVCLFAALFFASSPATSQTWNWTAQCSGGPAFGQFEIGAVDLNVRKNFTGTLVHNTLRNNIRGTTSGSAIYFSRYIDDHAPTRTQTWEGYFDSATQISGGTLHDPAYGDCTWSASLEGAQQGTQESSYPQTWHWTARCSGGTATGWFSVASKASKSFSGTLVHNGLRNEIKGSISGNAINFSRYIDDHAPTRTQTWEGYFDSATQISGGRLHDPAYGDCTWSASLKGA